MFFEPPGVLINAGIYKGNRCADLWGPWTTDYAAYLLENNVRGLRLELQNDWTDDNVEFLKEIPFIQSLEIFSSKITDISPIRHLIDLEVLELLLPNWNNLSELDVVADRVEKMLIQFCTKIERLDNLPLMKKLKFLQIENCRTIESLKPLTKQESLETFVLIGNFITDGDMGCLLPMDKLRSFDFTYRSWYSHNMQAWEKEKDAILRSQK